MSKRILAVADHCCASGFARVAHQILGYLHQQGYEIHVLGLNYVGEPHDRPYKVYPAQVFHDQGKTMIGDVNAVGALVPRIKEIRPDALFLFNDLHLLDRWLGGVQDAKIELPIVTYFPVDSAPIHPRLLRRLAETTNVTYTDWGRDVIRQAREDIPVSVIPHGVDTTLFHPRSRAEARAEMGMAEDLFIVFRCDRNSQRKNWPATFRVFQRFARGRDDARLFCHTVFRDVGGDLDHYLELFPDLQGKVWATSLPGSDGPQDWGDPMHGISDEAVALTYAISNVLLTTTTGEGWGLAVSEAQATGLPVIGTNCSSLTELLSKGRGVPVRVQAHVTGPYGSDFAIIDESAAASALGRVYRDHAYAEAIAQQGLAFARSLDWKDVLPHWGALFRRTVGK